MGKRKKKRTHVLPDTDDTKIPKALVFRRNKIGPPLIKLMTDLREVFLPFTAPKLKDKPSNSIKDFVSVAGPYGVSHFLMLTGTDVGSYLRIARVPQGPTLTFRISQYSHSSDVRAIQTNPHSPGNEFLYPAVLVMSGFKEKTDPHIDLMRITFKEIFPAIPVHNIDLDHCRRCVLFHYDEASETVEFRHYLISAFRAGLNKSIKRVLQHKTHDLSSFKDISDYVLSGLGNTESDNEAQDSKILDTRKNETRKGATTGTTKTVRLQEIGPRMKLALLKVEEELCTGTVRYHKHIVKTEAEIREMQIRNNARKQREAFLKKLKEKREKEKELLEQNKEENNTTNSTTKDDANDDDDEEDIEWYRKEVGEEPDEEMKQTLKKSHSNSSLRVPQKYKKKRKREEQQEEKLQQSTPPNKKMKRKKLKSKTSSKSSSKQFKKSKSTSSKQKTK
eukprot:TRINITY_DN12854_c0_g1_i1.p1 TRINITY_DN12854_c0_g1~~TRINITY_DN12854_c0_g1_i1.p1  ORF type:complete len:448 (-),score=100.90 TRINITY_DN12854_c0_g1_i1:71-1414(-)